MRKKGVEMSLNVIIVAAIGLLVLVILAFLVVNYVGKTQREGLESCIAKGGTCETNCQTLGREQIAGTFSDCQSRTDGRRACCRVVSVG